MKLNELLEELNIIEKFNVEDTKNPTQSDLDDIYDAINTLNKCEWFVSNEKDLDVLIKSQTILQKLLDEEEG